MKEKRNVKGMAAFEGTYRICLLSGMGMVYLFTNITNSCHVPFVIIIQEIEKKENFMYGKAVAGIYRICRILKRR